MKPYMLLALYLFIASISYTQDAYPFINEDLQWVKKILYSSGHDPDTVYFESYQIDGDTTVSGVEQMKLLRDNYLIGSLYESDKRLYFTDLSGKVDTVLDFNLNLRDTFYLNNCTDQSAWNCPYLILNSIDSVNIYDGTVRKRFNFISHNSITTLNPLDSLSWIDDIGSTHGLIPDLSCGVLKESSDINSAICFTKLFCSGIGENTIYVSEDNQNLLCNIKDILDSNNNLNLYENLRIYPNPTTDEITIAWDAKKSLNFTVYNLQGQVLTNVTSEVRSQLQIPTDSWPEGMYIIKANERTVGKILIIR